MKKSTKSGLVVLILLIIAGAGYSLYTIMNQENDFENFSSTRTGSYRIAEDSDSYNPIYAKEYSRQFIGAVYIEGTIQSENNYYNQKWVLNTIQNLKENSKNAALAVFINSPGGAVYQADEVYLALQDYKTTGRPIYIYQGPMAASGGYYISCAGNKIYANRNTLTGSIGVIFAETFDLTGLFNKLGIKSTTIHSGKNKIMGNFNEPLSAEQKAILQSVCDECYDQFVGIVSKARGLTYHETVKIADGRIYTAKQALDLHLIDSIDSWEGMLRDLAEKELKKPGIKVNTYKKPKRKQSMLELLSTKAMDLETAKAASQLGVPVEVIKSMNNKNFTPMYLAPAQNFSSAE